MAKVTVTIEADESEEDDIREQVQGWIDGAYDLNPANYKMHLLPIQPSRLVTKLNKPDMVFLASRIDTFVDLVQDPRRYFNRNPDAILPESLDLKITAAALYLLVDCYLRGQGLRNHPRSSTQQRAMEALTAVMGAVDQEVEARPYMYPKLKEALGRGQAAVDLDLIVQGFSLWATDPEDV